MSSVKFICSKCKIEEEIPREVVDMMDVMDGGDKTVPPRFSCEKCGGIMEPEYYESKTGKVYGKKGQKNID